MIRITSQKEDTITLELSNGHKEAIDKIVADYNLKGTIEAISFILSIISEADGKAINNGKGSFVPSENLRNSK